MEPIGHRAGDIARVTAVVTIVVLSCVIATILLWQAASAILVVLIGILAAVIFDAGARGLGLFIPLPRKLRLAFVLLLTVGLLVLAILWGGTTLVEQAGQLFGAIRNLLQRFNRFLASGAAGFFNEEAIDLSAMVPSASALFGGATRAVTTTFGALLTFALVVFLGAFFAWNPQAYKGVILSLLPQGARPRVNEVLDQSAEAMRGWLVGQSISMVVIFTFTFGALALVGMPYSLLLAASAGLLTFIPTIGPFIAGVGIVAAGLSVNVTMALYGLGIYLVVQFLESNLLTPIVQQRTVYLPPASTLAIQMVAGVLFGILGIAFAVPLAAAGKVLIAELYVKDILGGAWEEAED